MDVRPSPNVNIKTLFSYVQNRPLIFYLWALGLFLRILFVWTKPGFKQMDEHWQVFEPAMGLVDGLWSKAHEWNIGGRSWILPILVSWILKSLKFLEMENPLYLACSVRTVLGILGSLSIPLSAFFTHQLLVSAERDHSSQPRALAETFVAAFVALWPYSIYCSTHAHGEMIGALFFLLGLINFLGQNFFLTGFWFSLAFILKIDVAVGGALAAASVFLFLPSRQRVSALLRLCIAAVPFIFLLGWVDKLKWGVWFQSVLVHGEQNLVQSIGNQWGVSPWYEHIYFVVGMSSVPFLLALPVAIKKWPKLAPGFKQVWFICLGFILVFAGIAHKEKRFMAPLMYCVPALSMATFIAYGIDWMKRSRMAIFVLSLGFFIHSISEFKNYVFNHSWEERVLALVHVGQIPGIQKVINMGWNAVFYYPRNIPIEESNAEVDDIARKTEGLKLVGMVMDGVTLARMEANGFTCTGWPRERRQSRDPVPAAFRCERP